MANSDDDDGLAWANACADQIIDRGYANMGVTYSPGSEYGDSVDILRPMPATFRVTLGQPMTDVTGADIIAKAQSYLGKLNDGPDVPRIAREIGQAFPDLAQYCTEASNTMPWCGDFVAYVLMQFGIRPPPVKNDVGFFFVDRWLDFGTPIPVGQEQPGDVAIFLGNPHHVTFVEGGGKYVGGNQSDAVTRASFRSPDAVRRAPTIGVATRPPTPQVSTVSNFKKCLPLLLKHEGGNDDDPRDPGGRTSRGILQREWDAWRQSHPGLPSDVWQAPQEQVEAIYKLKYWDAMNCDALPSGVDYAVFDYGVNSGIGRAPKVLQRIVGVEVDGDVGPLTIAATLRDDPKTIVNQICDERLSFLQGLSTWGTFGRGWSTRVADVRRDALAMAGTAKPIEGVVLPPIKPGDPPIPIGTNPFSNPILLAGLAALFSSLTGRSQMTNTTGQGFDLSKLFADLPKFIVILQDPILQRLLADQPVRLSELKTLPPEFMSLITGGKTPTGLLSGPAPQPQPEPPKAVDPAPVATAPPAVGSPLAVNSATGLIGALGALIGWATGNMGDTAAIVTAAGAGIAAATGIPAPIINGLWGFLKRGAAKVAGQAT